MIAATETSGVETPTSRIVYDMLSETYHAKTLGVASKSALDKINQSPLHYLAWLREESQPTPAMRFGSLFHLYALELPKALASIVVMPKFSGKGSVAAREEWKEAHADKEVVDQEEWDTIRYMGDAVHKHPIAARLLNLCKPEVSIKWTDAETGLQCKSRVDGWVESHRVLLDLKTTGDASPREFAKSSHNYRYHVQSAFYQDGFHAIGNPVKAFIFVAVEKVAPFAVATYQLDQDAVDLGREQYQANMRTLADCLERDEWPGYSQGIEELSLPRWAY